MRKLQQVLLLSVFCIIWCTIWTQASLPSKPEWPSSTDKDWLLDANPGGIENGLLRVFNPLDHPVKKDLDIPLYYTGLSDQASLSQEQGKAHIYTLEHVWRSLLEERSIHFLLKQGAFRSSYSATPVSERGLEDTGKESNEVSAKKGWLFHPKGDLQTCS